MFANPLHKLIKLMVLLAVSVDTLGHGVIGSPPSRSALCGLNDQADNPESALCAEAFAGSGDRGVNPMAIVTNDLGRKARRSTHVCSFDAAVWGGEASIWDKAINWPATDITGGANAFVWNTVSGQYIEATEEFVYYITKPDFVFQLGVPLRWDDFDALPFCELAYDDNQPTANAAVLRDAEANTFTTVCDVPPRSGRHVIYGEWGQNQAASYQRFHSCIDVQFIAATLPDTAAPQALSSLAPAAGPSCEHVVIDQWRGGFQGEITITNTSNNVIDGWQVTWSYRDASQIYQLWDASHSRVNGEMRASHLERNAIILPGQTLSFGFLGTGGTGEMRSGVDGVNCQ